MSRHPAIAVVIPARDARATVASCIECLAVQRLEQPWEAVLVDNGSRDGTAEAAAEAAARCELELRIERLPRGRGPAAPRNHGAAVTTAPAVAFLDADCFATSGWLAAGVRALADADLVQGRVVPDRDFVRGPFDRTLHVNGPSPLFETANLFVLRSLFERVGGFEDWLEPGIARPVAEDVWFGWSAVRAGARRSYAPEALVEHAVFREGAVSHVLERRRLAHFPALAARIPELREDFFFGRWFLNRRTAAFDLAVVAVASRRRSLAPLALPYLWVLLAEALPWRRLAPKVVPVRLAADAVGLMALLRGSAHRRHVVI
jgi:glycosyltransferase involved in cell wall biosynthesis